MYDYLQRGDNEHLHVLAIPTVEKLEPSLGRYNDSISNGGQTLEKRLNEQKRGFMSQPEPWDVACLYRDAFRDWPQDAASLNLKSAPAGLMICGDPEPDLRATRIEPPEKFLTRFSKAAQYCDNHRHVQVVCSLDLIVDAPRAGTGCRILRHTENSLGRRRT